MNKQLFIRYSCFIEGLTGIGLILLPVKLVLLIFGVPLSEASGIMVSMVAGVAILSLSYTWWSLRTTSSDGVVKSLLFYNAVLSVVLIYGLVAFSITAPVIWIIIIFHLVQSLISGMLLRKNR